MTPAPSVLVVIDAVTARLLQSAPAPAAMSTQPSGGGTLLLEPPADGGGGNVRMVGILFAPPEAPLTKEQITGRIPQFYHRNANHIDLFCAGYVQFWSEPHAFNPQFDYRLFNEFRRTIEGLSRWKYSGEVDLLVLNAHLDRDTGKAALDFASTVNCQLDAMIKEEAIRSVAEFFERLFQFAETHSGKDPSWGFSDAMAAAVGRNSIVLALSTLIPEWAARGATKAKHFAVRDVRKMR